MILSAALGFFGVQYVNIYNSNKKTRSNERSIKPALHVDKETVTKASKEKAKNKSSWRKRELSPRWDSNPQPSDIFSNDRIRVRCSNQLSYAGHWLLLGWVTLILYMKTFHLPRKFVALGRLWCGMQDLLLPMRAPITLLSLKWCLS
jgi:hypothetical protein